MTHASLFSGIGGFNLAAEWAGWKRFQLRDRSFLPNHTQIPLSQCKAIRRAYRTADFTIWKDRIDVLTGGSPCQPFSLAGKWRGTEDDRYLWPAMLDVIRTVRPRWVVGENVYGIVNWSAGLSSNRCALTWRRQDTRCIRTYRLAVSALPTVGTDVGLLPTVQTQGLKRCVNGKIVLCR